MMKLLKPFYDQIVEQKNFRKVFRHNFSELAAEALGLFVGFFVYSNLWRIAFSRIDSLQLQGDSVDVFLLCFSILLALALLLPSALCFGCSRLFFTYCFRIVGKS